MHKHHIIPKHAGGIDDASNIIELTIEQHAEEHRKLFEQYGRWQDYVAWQGLLGRIGKEEIHRMAASEANKKRKRTSKEFQKGWETRRKKGWKPSEKVKESVSRALKGRPKGPCSKKHRENISKSIKTLYDSGQLKGSFPNHDGTKWWNNGVMNKRSIECPGEEWVLGRLGDPKRFTPKKWKKDLQ